MYSLEEEKDYQCNCDIECLLVCSIISVLNICFVVATVYLIHEEELTSVST